MNGFRLYELAPGDFTLDSRMMIHVTVKRSGRTIYEDNALNDAVVTKGAVARVIQIGHFHATVVEAMAVLPATASYVCYADRFHGLFHVCRRPDCGARSAKNITRNAQSAPTRMSMPRASGALPERDDRPSGSGRHRKTQRIFVR